MTIGEKIKYLRQKNDITQEKLAEYLNITYQAISKWENNNALPDISLVVPLANFFGVSIDELFDRTDEAAQADIEEYDRRQRILANKGDVAGKIPLWREATAKYPNNFHCLYYLAYALWQTLNTDLGIEKEELDRNAQEVVDICERILEDCTENRIRNKALQLLVFTYADRSHPTADEEKAEKYAMMASEIWTCREMLLEHAYFTEEGEQKSLVQKHINNLNFMDCLCDNLFLCDYASTEERLFACKTALKLWQTLIYDGNFLFYHIRISFIHRYLARSYAKLGDKENALENLRAAKLHAEEFDRLPEGRQNYTSIFISRATDDKSLHTKNYPESSAEILKQSLSHATYDFMRGDPEFIEYLNSF